MNSGVINIGANRISNENNLNNKTNIIIEDTSERIANKGFTNISDLGDEQEFDFIPGFAKN